MRVLVLIGVLLAGFGAFVLIRGFSYTKNRSEIKVGEFSATVQEKASIPPWVGGVAVVAGLALIVTGAGKRRG